MNTVQIEKQDRHAIIDLKARSKPVDPFPPIGERPCYRVYEKKVRRDGREYRAGVYYHHTTTGRDGEQKSLIDDYLCGVLKVEADTKDTNGQSYGKLLSFKPKDGAAEKRINVPMDMVLNERSGDLIRVLGNEGLFIDFHKKRYINAYINAQNPKKQVEAAHTTGWHGSAFVFPDEVVGSGDVWFQSSGLTAAYSSKGNLTGWQAGVSDIAKGNPLLQLAICGALAGTLLNKADHKGGGLHFYGDSSKGKSTALEAASSVWGQGATFYQTWNATANALEGAARLHTDTMLGLDEIHNCRARDVDKSVYAILNGVGRGRANERGDAKSVARWRVFCISNGEYSIPDALARENVKHMAGQGVRLLDIYATGEEYGFFSCIHDATSPAVFAQNIKKASNEHYGHAGKAFIRYLVGLAKEDEPDYSEMLNSITESLSEGVGDQERRAAQLFALCALAGELAINGKILTWDEGQAIEAARHGFQVWLEQRGTHGRNAEDVAIYRGILDFVDTHGGSRFEELEGEARVINHRAGWKRCDDGKTVYMFTSAGLREATGKGIRPVAKALASIGAFADRDDGVNSKQTRIGKDNVRLYHIDTALIREAIND